MKTRYMLLIILSAILVRDIYAEYDNNTIKIKKDGVVCQSNDDNCLSRVYVNECKKTFRTAYSCISENDATTEQQNDCNAALNEYWEHCEGI